MYNNMKINDLLGYVWDTGGWGERRGEVGWNVLIFSLFR